jgi:alkanesulfonate monooxygenase SsuD/methylene tetrahydromethanopterin reductase-like flavin-dependent oxidoreductase (luciferase family)
MLDVISGGRLIAGFPFGTPMDDCFACGTNPSRLRARYLEAHDLVMKAWQEKETFAFSRRYNQQRYVNIWPRPIQQPHPPIWIPGGRIDRDVAVVRLERLRLLLSVVLRPQGW